MFVFVLGIYYCVSFLVLKQLEEEERVWCFSFIVLRVSCCRKCSAALPHSAVG